MTAGDSPASGFLSPQYWMRSRHDLVEAGFLGIVQEQCYPRLWFESLPIADGVSSAKLDGEQLLLRRTDAGEFVLLRHPETVSLVELRNASAVIEVAGADENAVRRRRDALAAALGAMEPPEDEVPLTFWAAGRDAPRFARRRIKAPKWSTIARNYSPSVARSLTLLIGTDAASIPGTGRLVLWHGAPGTGKTSALRALARAWCGWCSTHFITDPEVALGASTSYLLDVLASESAARDTRAAGWKLIVLEDSGELLASDAHERTGQALSRLLNVTDGLIGQGMQVIVLVTTNEPLGRLHPAVQRSGRCWAEVEFEPLSADQATHWLRAAGRELTRTKPTALADLYALLRGETLSESPVFGFAAA